MTMFRQSATALTASLALLATGPAWATDLEFDLTGRVSLYGKRVSLDATDLVPDPDASGYQDALAGLSGVMGAKLSYGRLSLAAQFRAEARDGQVETFTDEAFAELLLGESLFVFGGRRILSYGQAYGLNPADILHDPLAENRIFPSGQARSDVEGTEMIGADLLFDNGSSLSLIYAPDREDPRLGVEEDFAMLRFSGLMAGGAGDYSVALIDGNRPGAALSFSWGLGDASVIYMDATFRKGREKQAISGTSPLGHLMLETRDTDKVHPFVTLGFGYTFENGVSLNAEYTRDAGGYSDSEWDRIVSALDTITPTQSAVHGQSLNQLNGLLNHYTLRQNYGFLRVSHDSLFGKPVSGELTVLHGLDDGSGSLGLRLEMPLGEQATLGLSATHKYGGENTEFTLRPEGDALAIYTTMKF
ncbi:hypothetical protein J7443_00315 [Tropicibacter sp. R15_0]|uniref:hypothetical protein n=1 Tax=Tropicibacter sp. R15_0 TaxID=2821101 RepID=UPI001ADB97F7|nr:hypothetical protein [Tropicibacter sp. R15_0]MBO9463660.1 hypothetical protein [Tropicibacter sp. R15_0]